MAGNPFLNSIAKNNRQGDPRFGRFGAGGQIPQQNTQYNRAQYDAQTQYGQAQYNQGQYGQTQYGQPQQGYAQPEYQNQYQTQPGYDYDQQYTQQPAYTPVAEGERLTMNDVIMKTGLSLAMVVLGAAIGWFVPLLMFLGLIGGLTLGLVNSFKKKVSPVLVLGYALFEGMLLGGLSGLLNARYPGVAIQAVVATVLVFGALLALFSSGKIRATPKLNKIFMVGLISYLGFFIVSWVSSILFNTSLTSVTFMGIPLGLIVGVFGVAMASYSLVLDFTTTSEAVEAGLPERESWRLAFGLTASLVWLYIEILRILMYVYNMVSDN